MEAGCKERFQSTKVEIPDVPAKLLDIQSEMIWDCSQPLSTPYTLEGPNPLNNA